MGACGWKLDLRGQSAQRVHSLRGESQEFGSWLPVRPSSNQKKPTQGTLEKGSERRQRKSSLPRVLRYPVALP
ncbi:hypothetical protein MPNT_40002 [Candidatus Methylacidithermus pantelleriae]|uniref:Uncharacterized protein n=1 Tax=Candidatus Methylacidithermus pantelleriae TaxID=2744239 RepID=A0A8J2FS74_9BACT|nr:hypothetical protein MPNT_40002 [Candidatus Methylacidithermus pantelleriae]